MKIKLYTIIFLSSISHQVFAQNLVETYQLAIDNDPLLRRAYYNQLSVGESKAQSISKLLPTLSANAQTTRNRLNNKKITFQGSGTQHYWDHGFSINFTQPVFHWDHWVELSQSNNKIAQAEAEYQAEIQNLIVKTTESYFDILAAQDSLEFSISEQTAIARQLDQAQQRFDVGLIAITDVYEAQAGFDQAKSNQIEAENLLDDSKEALREIIGDNEANIAALVTEVNFLPPSPNDINQWAKIAATSNLNIIAALNQAETKRKDISIQRSGHLPTIDIIASYGLADVNSTFGLRGDTQNVGVQINIPLFQGGSVYSRTKQAEFDYKVAKETLLSTKRSINRQLKNAFRDVLSNLSRVKALNASVSSAKSALEATESGFEVGTRTMVDVLSEQRNLYRAKRDYSRSRYDYLISGIKLKQAASSLTEQDLQSINQYLIEETTTSN